MSDANQTIEITAGLPDGWQEQLAAAVIDIQSRTACVIAGRRSFLVELPRWKRIAHALGRWLLAL